MADFISHSNIAVDLFNDQPFLDAMQRAIDLSTAVERTLEAIRNGAPAPLEALETQNKHFRDFFDLDEGE